MTNFNSRSNIQLRLLTSSKCVQDLISWSRANDSVICNNCLAPEDFATYKITYRHRVAVGTGTDITTCASCFRFLNFVRPSRYCPIYFKIVIDFLSTRSDSELSEIDRDTEPHIIMLERHMTRYN